MQRQLPSCSDYTESNIARKFQFFAPSQHADQSIFAIIDMQPSFIAAKKPSIIYALGEALKNAMNEGQYILIVNYDRGDRDDRDNHLHPELSKIIDDYSNTTTLWKKHDNGAREILDHLKSRSIPFSRICVAGINVCGCVASTVKNLSENQDNFLIELNEPSCTCDCSSREGICTRYTIATLEHYRGVINGGKNEKNLLKSALINSDHLCVQKILAEYELKVPEYVI